MSDWQFDEQEIREHRAQRLREMQKRKHRQMLFRKYYKIVISLVAVIILIAVPFVIGNKAIYQSTIESRAKEKAAIENEEIQNAESQNAEALRSTDKTEKEQEEVAVVSNQVTETTTQNTQVQETAIQSLQLEESEQIPEEQMPEVIEEPAVVYEAQMTADTVAISDEIVSNHALLIDLESGEILAQKDAQAIISPASMTKVLTVLVAAEQLEEADLDDTFTMTLEITDYSFVNDCSNVGFLENEVITVRDLFYGTILPSGGDAAVGLATYVAGSHEAFVDLMNQKLEELGLAETAHFTNCVGLYDEEHYCTIYDMAMIMEAALENELCREVMSTKKYTTSPTEQHPEGITISNWFLRRIEDKDIGGEVICGKTGYVAESGNCAVSFGIDHAGKEYVCATADSTSSWRCIYDHVALYKEFATEAEQTMQEAVQGDAQDVTESEN